MSRYFFHIDYGELTRDEDGTLFPSHNAARAAAVNLLGELLRDEGDQFWGKPNVTITVADEAGVTLWTLTVEGESSGANIHRLER